MEAAFAGENNFGGITNYQQSFTEFNSEVLVEFELIFKIPITDLFNRKKSSELRPQPRSRRITLDLSQISLINDAVSSTADSATSTAASKSGKTVTRGESKST